MRIVPRTRVFFRRRKETARSSDLAPALPRALLLLTVSAINAPALAQIGTITPSDATVASTGEAPWSNLFENAKRHPRLPHFGSQAMSETVTSTDAYSRDEAAGLRWWRKTPCHGSLNLEAHADPDAEIAPDGSRPVEHFLLSQQGLALNDAWRMDHALGDQHTRTQAFTGSGYRYSLPDATFRGTAGRGYKRNTEISWVTGRTGELKGEKVKSFRYTSSTINGLGAQQSLNRHWRIGGHTWLLRGDAEAEDRHNIAAALQYMDADNRRQHALRFAEDGQAHWGLWMDNDQWLGAWRQRYGFYRFEPRMRWINKDMPNDRQGLYWRTDHEVGNTL